MITPDKPQFQQMLSETYAMYDKPLTDMLIDAWFRALRDHPLQSIRLALEQHVQYGKFCPRPGDIQRRITGDESEKPKGAGIHRPTNCEAQGCPNPPSNYEPGPAACRFHGRAPRDQWPAITEGIIRGEERFEYPLTAAQKNQLGFLVEIGRYDELDLIAGEQGKRWARAEVKAKRLKPNGWRPSAKDYAATAQFLSDIAKDPGYEVARETELHDDGSLSP